MQENQRLRFCCVRLLTTSTSPDIVVGISGGDDTVTATSATMAATDIVVDQSSTDNDTINITLTATNNTATIRGIENVNVAWNAFGTADFAADNVSGATITVSSSKLGFLGNAQVTTAGSNTIVGGSGVDGTLTVTGATNSTVNAGEATIVSVTSSGAAATSVVVNAGSGTTDITVADYNAATVNAGTADTVSLTDDDAAADDGDTATLNFGADVTLTNNVDDLTVNATAADLTLTIDAIDASLVVTGDYDLTINVADANATLTAETVTNSGNGSITLAIDELGGNADLDAIDVDLITIAAAATGGNITIKDGARVVAETDLASAYALVRAGSGTSDTATLVLQANQGSIITTTGIETLTIETDETAVSGVDITIAEINAGTNDVVLTGANDVTITLLEAGDLNASALTNNLIVTQDAAAAQDITGGSANNTVVFKGTTHTNNFVGQDGNDTVTFVNTSGSATAVVANGTNTVTANALTTGDLVVTAGTGVDTVSATALTTGAVTLDLGNGANVVTLDGTFNQVDIVITTGSGADSITIADATVATDVITLVLGDGTDTLTISEDMTAGIWSVSGLDVIAIGSSDTAAIVNATLLNGQTYTITGDGTATDHLAVEFDAAGTGDFSGIVITNTLTKGLAGLSITGTAGNQTIVGTSGADVIDGTDGTDFITGGVGVDSITAGTGVDTFIYAAGDSGTTTATADSIAGFTSGTDKLDFNISAGSATNYAEVLVDVANMAAGKTAADTAMDGTVIYYFTDDGTDGYFFADTNGDGTADLGIIITGVTDMAFGDIIA